MKVIWWPSGGFIATWAPGFREIRRGPNGNYYILTAPAPAVLIYDPSGKRVGQIPSVSAAAAKGAALVYGESFDVDHDGRVVVCDRGAKAVKIYSPDGALAAHDSDSAAGFRRVSSGR